MPNVIHTCVPNGTHSRLTTYAKSKGITLTNAIENLLEIGLQAELDPPANRSDIERLIAHQETTRAVIVQAIKEQPITLQELPPPKQKHKFLKFFN